MVAPFTGLRVLDLSRGPAGGIATMILADFGADVITIEPPGGDPFRALAAGPMWLRGKRSVVLDLKTAAGVERLHALVPAADVVVAGFRPGVVERLGAGFDTLAAINPRLVYCAITGFGPSGPYRGYKGYEGVVAARSGRMMSFEGQNPRPGPAFAAVQVGIHATAQSAVQGIVAALIVRERTGRGQLVETSLLQGMLPFDMGGLIIQQLIRKLPEQFPVDPFAVYNRQPTLQYQPVLTKDGRWLQLGNLVEHLYHAYLIAAGLEQVYADPRFEGVPRLLSDESREALRDLMLERMQERTLDEWMATFIADGNVAAEPFVTTQQALCHPQALYSGDVVTVEHPRHGAMTQLGLVAKLTQTPGRVPASSPEAGEHTESVLAEVPPSPAPVSPERPAQAQAAPPHPLAGVTVVEFASIIATPLACALLADLGARVIKVEPPEGDGLRALGGGTSAAKTTAGKESICVDLKAEAGRRIARQLIEGADILVHNYRPSVPERLGIGYEQVREYNPRIVYVSATGYGSDGPYAHRPSAHPIAGAATGGVLWQAGAGMSPETVTGIDAIRETARRLMRANEVNPDPSSAVVIATAALLGLYVRRTQGIGQHVQTNMFVANAYANADDFLSYAGKPERLPVDADLHGLHALYRLYPTADGWIFLACPFEEEWRRLVRALDRPDLADDPRFRDQGARRSHDGELIAVLGEIFCTRGADAWEELLTGHDLACARADRGGPGVFWDTDEHARVNGFVRDAEHARWGAYRRHGPTVTLRETPGRYGPGVLAGEHTEPLLRGLGYSAEEIDRLTAAGVVRSEAP